MGPRTIAIVVVACFAVPHAYPDDLIHRYEDGLYDKDGNGRLDWDNDGNGKADDESRRKVTIEISA